MDASVNVPAQDTLPLVADTNFVQATRDTGYRSTAAAVAELVDNSLQAGADEIHIIVTDERVAGERRVRVAVLDNGCGMTAEVLHEALQFGGTDRFGDRSGLGRFGMGLPNSSVSQTRRFEVITWRSHDQVLHSYLDIDEVATGLLHGIPAPQPAALPVWLHDDLPAHGTAVVWSRCDRLRNRKASTLVKTLRPALGRIFRRSLWKGIRLLINGVALEPYDPLFCHPLREFGGARPYGPPLNYEIATPDGGGASTVVVRFTELPVEEWHSLSVEEKRQLGIVGGAGVSILRAGREIDYGWHLLGGKRRENYDDWWRCEIEFSPELDELFGVTHSKQGITPTAELRAMVSEDLEGIARTLNARVRERFDILRAAAPSKALDVAAHRDFLLPALSVSRSTAATDRLIYQIRTERLEGPEFFSCFRRGNVIRLIINQDHLFFDRVYAPALAEAGGRTRYAIETMLLAAARARLANMSEDQGGQVDRFIEDWSHVLAAFSEL